MPPALYVDEDSCDRRFIRALRLLGFDVLTTTEAGRLSVADADQLSFATSVGRVIVTANDRDFSRLQADWGAAGETHAGIIVIRRREQSPETLARTLLARLEPFTADDFRNGILHV